MGSAGRTGGSGTTGGSPAAGGGGRGGRGVFLADEVLVSNMQDLAFTGGGGPTGSTGREGQRKSDTKVNEKNFLLILAANQKSSQ